MALTADDKEFIVRALAGHASVTQGAFGGISFETCLFAITKATSSPSAEAPPGGHLFIVGQQHPVAVNGASDQTTPASSDQHALQSLPDSAPNPRFPQSS